MSGFISTIPNETIYLNIQNNKIENPIQIDERIPKIGKELFGNALEDLNFNLEKSEKTLSRIKILTASLFTGGLIAAGIGGTLSNYFGFNNMGIFSSIIGVSGGCVSFFSVIISCCYTQKIDQTIEDCNAFLAGSYTISNVYECFEDFKKNPDPSKISTLFDMFDRINEHGSWFYLMQAEKISDRQGIIVDDQIVRLLTNTGKLFLMDAIAKILKDDIYHTWKETLNAAKKLEVRSELWNKFKLKNPDLKSYADFQNVSAIMKSDFLVIRIVSIYQRSLTIYFNTP